MNINKKKQNINFKNQQYVFLMYYATNIYIFFSIFFFFFSYFITEILILKSFFKAQNSKLFGKK